MTDAIGIMDPAFFVGKNVLINWVNEFLQVQIKKVEEMATGSYYCQLLDAIYPGKVPLHKVNFFAKFDYEYVKNFKVLQDIFVQQGIQKYVDVSKLVKAKYQDNLEFFQWMKRFFDTHYAAATNPYSSTEKRNAAISSYNKGLKHGGSSEVKQTIAPPKAATPASGVKKSATAAKTPAATAAKKPAVTTTTAAATAKAAVATENKSAEIEELNSKLDKLKQTIEGLEKERNFYFGKLRSIEVLCQQDETKDAETKAAVLKILYQTDNEEEFQAPATAEATDTAAPVEGTVEAAAEVQPDASADAPVADGDLLGSGNADDTF